MMVALKEKAFYLERQLTDIIDEFLKMVLRVSQECYYMSTQDSL